MYEDKLIPLFQRAGQLYEFRLMMNFSGQNRGFAYAKYGDPQSAATAIRFLHKHELQQGVQLAVRRSTEKRQLSLGDLPTSVNQERLLQVLQGLSEGVEAVSVKFGKGGKRNTASVHYTTHYTASMAKKVLCEGRPGWDRVEWMGVDIYSIQNIVGGIGLSLLMVKWVSVLYFRDYFSKYV